MAKKPIPSPEVVRQLMTYNPDTGKLFWKERPKELFKYPAQADRWNNHYAGKEAFTPTNSTNYHTGAIWGKMLLAHRVAWAIHYGQWPDQFLDHINGVRTDNRICNLREATQAENRCNAVVGSNSASGVKGVRWDARESKWQARVTVSRKQKHLGYFDNIEDAAAAYAAGAAKYHGEFARAH